MALLHDLTCRRCVNRSLLGSAVIAPIAALFGRGAKAEQKPEPPVPGSPRTGRSDMLDAAAAVLQTKPPLDAMSAFLNGFHFYADDLGRQVEANHYCTHLNEDFHQCVIYSSNRADAKLIGIEYIISERIFATLPEEEKRLWHSHNYEVKSGELIAPGVPEAAGHALMRELVTTYGKTWHTWQIDRDHDFPMGIPQLMMGFTADGQLDPGLVADRDRRFGSSISALRQARADIPSPKVAPGANAWESGTTVQLTLKEVPVRNLQR